MLNEVPPPLSFLFCFHLCFRYGFGEAGKLKFGIVPEAELVYEVTLKSFEKVRVQFLACTTFVCLGSLLH